MKRAIKSLSSFIIMLLLVEIRVVHGSALLHHGLFDESMTNETEPDPYHKSGCHLVGFTRKIKIEGCQPFNLSTNACRGLCVSYSIPRAEGVSSEILEPPEEEFVTQLDPAQAEEMAENPMKGYPIEEEEGTYFGLAPGQYDRDEDENEDEDIISVSQCCVMKDSQRTTVRVLCYDGYRTLEFHEALSCDCSLCTT